MTNMLKTRPCVMRANAEGYEISEYALRQWIRSGAIPARKIGNSFLIYYPNLIRFLQCAEGCDNGPATSFHTGIRRVDAG